MIDFLGLWVFIQKKAWASKNLAMKLWGRKWNYAHNPIKIELKRNWILLTWPLNLLFLDFYQMPYHKSWQTFLGAFLYCILTDSHCLYQRPILTTNNGDLTLYGGTFKLMGNESAFKVQSHFPFESFKHRKNSELRSPYCQENTILNLFSEMSMHSK